MNFKNILRSTVFVSIILSFSCKDELEDCYETVCTGPNNTNCEEVPKVDSGCFPRETGTVSQND